MHAMQKPGKSNHLIVFHTSTDVRIMYPPVRRELEGVQFDHGHNVPLIVIGHLLHTSILGHPHPTLGAGQAGDGGGGWGEGV